MPKVTGQVSIANYGDVLTLSGFITSNHPRVQQYNPDTRVFKPNWTTAPLELTVSLFRMGTSSDVIGTPEVQEIKWYDGSNPSTPLTTGGAYNVNGKTLRVNQNVLGTRDAMDFICEVRYRDFTNGLDIIHKMVISFSKVQSGAGSISAIAWAPDGNIFKNKSIATLKAECDLWRGGVVTTTGTLYQWYRRDPSVTTDQGGGLGWRKLTSVSNSGETNYTTRQMTVPADAVPNFKAYKCVITDNDNNSATKGQTFQDTVAFTDQSDPIQMSIISTGGDVFKNGVGTTQLTALLFQSGDEIDDDGAGHVYRWYKYKENGQLDLTFGSSGVKTGKSITVTSNDVNIKATFVCEVEGTATAQITITDLTDVVLGDTEPANPVEGMVWLKTAGGPPYRFYVYKGGSFKPTDYESLSQLDPDAAQRVEEAYNSVMDLSMDSKLTRYERSIVRKELNEIIGRYLNSNENMPTLAEIDSSSTGDLFAIRRKARILGLPTTEPTFVRVGNAYTALRTYLSGLSIKPWDINSAGTLTIVPTEWDSRWEEYYFSRNALLVKVNEREKAYADEIAKEEGEKAKRDAVKEVNNSNQYLTTPITDTVIIDAPITAVALPSFKGRHQDMWGSDTGGNFADNGNRIRGIGGMVFSSGGGSFSINATFFGDGTNNDEFTWDSLGNAVRIRSWQETMLDGSMNIVFHSNGTGIKYVRIDDFSEIAPLGATIRGVNHKGKLMTTVSAGFSSSPDEVRLPTDNKLVLSVAETESGWGINFTPSTEEVQAYFWGWRMCNGTYNTSYNGSGNKVWYPIGDPDLSRSTASSGVYGPVPKEASPTLKERTINRYQMIHRMADSVYEMVTYDGMIQLIQGPNQIDLSYPSFSPKITSGTYKYAINLATATQDIRQLIPTLQRRLSKAEEVITDDSIVNTVMQSVEYKISQTGKANVEDLGGLATRDELDDVKAGVDDKIANAIDTIDFEPYVTQSQLAQTATDITAKFSAAGGMNLVRNSIGFSDLDFWSRVYGNETIESINTNELDSLGFGSGFFYRADGVNKGIQQDIEVIPGQRYTLSWYLKKLTGGASSSFRFFIQFQEQINGVWTTMPGQLGDNSSVITPGFKSEYLNYTPQTNKLRLRFIGYGTCEAILTGIMLTIGDVPLQWSLATGELYNTNIRLDINGIRVSQFDDDRNEVGFTQITPKEFAGYYDSEGNGVFEKIFYLNGEETVTKKFVAKDEITMGDVKIVRANVNGTQGWAFVPAIQ